MELFLVSHIENFSKKIAALIAAIVTITFLQR